MEVGDKNTWFTECLQIYKLSDYSKLWIDEKFYPYGNEFMIK